ncbi:MAG: epoxyqueuosine reductase QueH [Oscillospiraceae bacterium]
MEQINYQKQLEKLLDNIKSTGEKPSMLLHSCCAPCSSYVLKYLSDFFKITVFYFNPNIFPIEEYLKRKEEQKRLITLMNSDDKEIYFTDCDYDYNSFLDIAKGLENEREGGDRCTACYKLRLEAAANKAKELECDYFGTTLTVSPYKNAKKLNDIGKKLESDYEVKFFVSDFKKREGYKISIELSKKYNLYRQDYCGCEFSLRQSHEQKEKKNQNNCKA